MSHKHVIPADARPSEVTSAYWLHADRYVGDYPASTPRSGKWLLFVPVEQVDAVWNVIKRAVEEGRLGDSAKVATARPNPNASNPNAKVIYTIYDGSSFVRGVDLVAVDGYRATLPIPEAGDVLLIDAWEYRFACIINGAAVDNYLSRAGLSVKQ